MHELMHVLRRMERKLNLLLRNTRKMEHEMSVEFDDLKREVEESRTVTESAAALIQGLADEIRANKDDPAALEELAKALDAQTQSLASSVSANTPNPEPPGPTPSGM